MQAELEAEHAGAIQLLAVNEVGFEDATDEMADLGDLPLLQDTVTEDAWNTWAVTYRDVVILDADNHRVGVYNLTQHDLSNRENYDALKQMLVDAIR